MAQFWSTLNIKVKLIFHFFKERIGNGFANIFSQQKIQENVLQHLNGYLLLPIGTDGHLCHAHHDTLSLPPVSLSASEIIHLQNNLSILCTKIK